MVSDDDRKRILEAITAATSMSLQDQFNVMSQIPGMDGGNAGNFFEKGKLMVETLGNAVSNELAIGPDGHIWSYRDGVYSPAPDEVEFRVTRALGNGWTRNRAAEVEANLRARRVLPELPEVPDLEVINLKNGYYLWRKDELHPHHSNYPSTAQVMLTHDAQAECPNFSAWLARAVPTDALQTTWEALGYALMFGNPLQRAFLLHGPRGTGKSTYLNVIDHMVGRRNISHVSLRDITESRFRVAEMAGKVANIMGDIDAKYLDDPSLFKAITGGDSILVEQKYRKPYTVSVWATPFFSSNSFWRSGDTTSAYLERFTVLSFPFDQRGQDDNFSAEGLYAEASGIFNKAMDSLRALMARGDFEVAGSLSDLRREFESESDIVRRWLKDDESVTFHEAGSDLVQTKRSVVYQRYCQWSKESHLKPLGAPEFRKRLAALGYTEKKNSDWYVVGIRLAPVETDWAVLAS